MSDVAQEDIRVLFVHGDDHGARLRGLFATDPDRVVRTLTSLWSPGNAPKTGGDVGDTSYVLDQLWRVLNDSESAVWTGLVVAGIVPVLCRCALYYHSPAKVSGKKPQKAAQCKTHCSHHDDETDPPWYRPLVIINGTLSRYANSAADTIDSEAGARTAADIKSSWSKIMQRIWSEPGESISATPNAVSERALVAIVMLSLTKIDSSFAEVIYNPADLTLAVSFRNWVLARDKDVMPNVRLLYVLLNVDLLPRSKQFRDASTTAPLPSLSPSHELLTRMVSGASKAAGTQKKRTPAQTAEAIVTAFAAQLVLQSITLEDTGLVVMFLRAFWAIAKTSFTPFARAAYGSKALWAALPEVMRIAAEEEEKEDHLVVIHALEVYWEAMSPSDKDWPEFADSMVQGWVSGGLFNALEESLNIILERENEPMLLTFVLTTMYAAHPRLSPKTHAAFYAQLPRTGMLFRLIQAVHPGEDEDLCLDDKPGEYPAPLTDVRPPLDPTDARWRERAWETLWRLTWVLQPADECAIRGCRMQSESRYSCTTGHCRTVQYCSKACRERCVKRVRLKTSDAVLMDIFLRDTEHQEMCCSGWFAQLEQKRPWTS
ncbi:hypothetical protein C8Q79DRAFT_366459 [Trametes meyenii]|nr:hypothetical protein C8Q79DRAFT_366459 [Trametes meyenii]